MSQSFQVSLAPDKLWQAINPWNVYLEGAQFGLINIDLGHTPRPEVEHAILDDVGSYGRQLGRIGDALEVLLNHIKLDGLSTAEDDALTPARSACRYPGSETAGLGTPLRRAGVMTSAKTFTASG